MRKLLALTGLAGVLLISLMASSAAAAPIVQQFHGKFSETNSNASFCGVVAGSSVVNGMDNIQVLADGTFKDEFTQKEVFTASVSGKSLEINVASSQISAGPIDNGDGTVTFVFTIKGLAVQFKVPNGPVVLQGRGLLSIRDTFDAATGDLISHVVVDDGIHPLAEGVDVCAVLVPLLT